MSSRQIRKAQRAARRGNRRDLAPLAVAPHAENDPDTTEAA